MLEFLDHLRRDPESLPLERQLYARLVDAILEGTLRPGSRLPSTRELAKRLGISRNTAVAAFEQLAANGFVESRTGTGTFVSSRLSGNGICLSRSLQSVAAGGVDAILADRAERFTSVAQSLRVPQRPIPFRMNMPAINAFPVALWRRLIRSLLLDRTAGAGYLLGETEPAGYEPLREAIARYVSISRGVACSPEQVIIVAGAQQGLDLAARLLVDPGDTAWCEDPGFPGALAALRAAGVKVGAVPVDNDGMDVADGIRRFPNARLVIVCPSSQFPLGRTLALDRRLALIDWARQKKAWIIEDDYDSEFRYRGRPIRSLQGLDGGHRIVYVGTFSKVLFPGLRLGYLIVPKPVIDLFVNARIVAGRQSPTFEQAVVERFMSEGHLDRHIARMRRLYAERRAVLIDALKAAVPEHLRLDPCEVGLQMIAWLNDNRSDAEISRKAAYMGLEVSPLSRLTVERTLPPALLLGFGNFTKSQILDGVAKLKMVLDDTRTGDVEEIEER